MKRLGIGLALILGFTAVLWWAHEPVAATFADWIKPPGRDPVPTLRLTSRPYTLAVRAEGELLGLQTTTLTAPQIRGSLKVAWLAKEGQIVRTGETVVEFDPAPARLALQQSENQFQSLGFQVEKTEQDSAGRLNVIRLDQQAAQEELAYAESQIRKDEDIFSRWEIQESLLSAALARFRRMTLEEKAELHRLLADSNLSMLQIDRRKTRREMDQAQETLSAMRLTAPRTGVLIYARRGFDELEVGTEVWPGQPLVEIAGLDRFRALVQIPEKDFTGVQPGLPVQVRVPALPENSFTGRVIQVARIAKQVQRENPRKYFESEILLDVPMDQIERLKPGMRVQAEIELQRLESAFVVPRSSVIRKDGGWVVFVAEAGGYREQSVQIRAGDHGFYLVEGLREGMVICLRHPFEDQKLVLPDFNLPAAAGQERFIIYW